MILDSKTRNQSEVKATYYITPVRSSAVLSNGNMGLKWIPRFLKQKKKCAHTHIQLLLIISQSQVLN